VIISIVLNLTIILNITIVLNLTIVLNIAIVLNITIVLTMFLDNINHIGGIMVSMLALSTVDCGFEPHSSRTKEYKFGIGCFSIRHTALRSKSKDRLAGNPSGATYLPVD
jgi:hypothetical protein